MRLYGILVHNAQQHSFTVLWIFFMYFKHN